MLQTGRMTTIGPFFTLKRDIMSHTEVGLFGNKSSNLSLSILMQTMVTLGRFLKKFSTDSSSSCKECGANTGLRTWEPWKQKTWYYTLISFNESNHILAC